METVGELIEKLIIENIRLWHLQDIVATSKSDATVAATARQIIEINKLRSSLRGEVTRQLGGDEISIKLYGEKHV